ncbi:predicted protein [Candida tropicalis MYA-3404]|uniref:Uncharacterized protein n=1 Tax=Candida tropicalis (strain ATCC MYA-3404 / T1) TaxID=294747 RepID=C5MED1_CANTT|nr:predicted protein [Candida tropicalis MYA-3404]EER31641.1 predicted protein [Candida tropicalis MYA-3404]KAG4405219.1 hypothetical protein JTP64_005255 [Candida tropicalis]MCP8717069.1 hypothetical protein [Asgard group archaeon]
MSHPEASIRSIKSGVLNLGSTDKLNDITNSSDISSNSYTTPSSRQDQPRDQIDDVSSSKSHYSVTSKNLKTLENKISPKLIPGKVVNNDINGTNSSIISTESEYQNVFNDYDSFTNEDIDDNDDDSLDAPQSQDFIDPFSRPLSRASTTSCVSTTATKDGVEGRRFHRHGPTPYSSHILSNMLQQQQQQQQQQKISPSKSMLSSVNYDEGNTLQDSTDASIASLHNTSIYPLAPDDSSSDPTVSSSTQT